MTTLDAASDWKGKQPLLYVAPEGNDRWSGRLQKPNGDGTDGPLATLHGARDAVRALKGSNQAPDGEIVIELTAGPYEMQEPVGFTSVDSGRAESPIIYRGQTDAEVRLMGGKTITGFSPVTDQDVLAKLEPSARDHVVCANLFDQGVSDFGELTAPGWGDGQPGLELFFKSRRMTIARWPNDGFAHVKSIDVPGNTELKNRVTLSGRMRGSNEGRFFYEGDRPKRWADERDVWLHGYWFWDWADQRQRVTSIDTEKRIIEMEGPNHSFGYREGQWYYAFNILSELDEPGEWYLDRETGDLYFWPPEEILEGDVVVSVAPHLITMEGTSNVAFVGLTLESACGTAITMDGGEGNLIAACNIHNASSWGVWIDGGVNHGVVGCDMYELGEGGIRFDGGDRVSLTPGKHYAVNNLIHHCSRWNPLYKPGIAVFGVGHRIAHNLLYELPHTAIGFTGNDQIIEFNEIHSAVYMANDAGAIYTSPPTEEFTMYGHTIRHNYVHHLYGFKNRGCNGAIYLDDFFPGTMMYGNIFYKVPRAAFIGGGRYNTIENNVFVDCTPSIHIDARGLGWAAGSEKELTKLLKDYPYTGELWSERFPTLVNILNDDPMVPKGNVVARNICWRGSWDEIEDKARPHVILKDNIVGVDPLFIDEERGDFQLRDDSPALKAGFERIPTEKIGLYNDELRASWPVKHSVRQLPT